MIVSFILLNNCSSKNKSTPVLSQDLSCVSEQDISEMLPKFIAFIETLKGEKIELKPIVKSCHKVKFSNQFLSVVLFRLPGMAKTHGSTINNTPDELKKTCWDKALHDINQLDELSVANRILLLHQKRYPLEWEDLDIGPSKWLQCQASVASEWHLSLMTLLHELAHQLDFKIDDKKCLYSLDNDKNLCFKLDEKLPWRSLAKLDLSDIPENRGRKFFEKIQKVYLTDIDQPVLNLLDELNAYSIDNLVQSWSLKQSKSSVIELDGARNPATVTLFQLLVKNYFERLKGNNSNLYHLTLASNKTPLKQLFSRSEDTYQKWLKELKTNNETEKMAEKEFRNKFKAKSFFFDDLDWYPTR